MNTPNQNKANTNANQKTVEPDNNKVVELFKRGERYYPANDTARKIADMLGQQGQKTIPKKHHDTLKELGLELYLVPEVVTRTKL